MSVWAYCIQASINAMSRLLHDIRLFPLIVMVFLKRVVHNLWSYYNRNYAVKKPHAEFTDLLKFITEGPGAARFTGWDESLARGQLIKLPFATVSCIYLKTGAHTP